MKYKKTIVILALIGVMLVPNLSRAATVDEIQAQLNASIQQLILLLTQKIVELQAQIAQILANQATQPAMGGVQDQIVQQPQTVPQSPVQSQPTQQAQAPIIATTSVSLAVDVISTGNILTSGAKQVPITSVQLRADGDSVMLKSVTFTEYDGGASSPEALSELTNLRLYYQNWDGSSGERLVDTMNNTESNAQKVVFNFSAPFRIDLNNPLTLTLKADVVSSKFIHSFGLQPSDITVLAVGSGDVVKDINVR